MVVCHFVLFYFGDCIVCPSSIYGFWLPLLYPLVNFSYIKHMWDWNVKGQKKEHRHCNTKLNDQQNLEDSKGVIRSLNST
jgi:hypothetical protein